MPTIKDILTNKSFTCQTFTSTENNYFSHVYTTDLISMVIKHGKNEPILITQISADATLAVAVMLDLPAIILTENHFFSKELIKKANEENIAILTTALTSVDVVIALVQMDLL